MLLKKKGQKKEKENRERKKKLKSQKLNCKKNLKILWKCLLTKGQIFFFLLQYDYLVI